jgi:hypothetical protein
MHRDDVNFDISLVFIYVKAICHTHTHTSLTECNSGTSRILSFGVNITIYLKKLIFVLISIYLLTAVELTPGGSSILHIYTQAVHRTTQLTTLVGRLSGIRTQTDQTKIKDELTT